MSFKTTHTLEERINESKRVMNTYTDRIPIICEKHRNSKIPDIKKKKYLVPKDLTVGQFIHVLRKQINIDSKIGLFIFINNNILKNSEIIYDCYEKHKDPDGFLYIKYDFENVFGNIL
jgi:GABA(A) receptor-associated protein